jgi:ATPase subunit of ABC transporter with duplicated ATPase domains
MDALGCPPDEASVAKPSGGERRRVALCRLLLEKPDLLLLDEPTNHLDAETVAWLEGHLRAYPGAILIVTHDRYFLDNVTGWILELDRGRGIPYEGNYSAWLKQKRKRLTQEGREEEARQRQLEAESEWIASSPKARQAKSKARIQRYEELVQKQNGKAPTAAQIVIPAAERLGNNVIEFAHLSKRFRPQSSHRRSLVQTAARRHRRRDRPERRWQNHALPHDHWPGETRLRHDRNRRIISAMSTNRATRSMPRKTCGKKFPAAMS